MVSDAAGWRWSSYRAMVGLSAAPSWLETDWVLGQFGNDRHQCQARYAEFVAEGLGQPSVWEGLRHQVFLGSDRFVERPAGASRPPKRLREAPRAQRRPLAKPLAFFERTSPDRREAMARAFLSGVYTMQETADHFGVHYSTVSRAVRRVEVDAASTPATRQARRPEPA